MPDKSSLPQRHGWPRRATRPVMGLVLALSSLPVMAATDADTLHTALSQIPETVFTDAKAGPARFIDLDVVSRLTGEPISRASLGRVLLAQGIAPLTSLAVADEAAWREHTGLAPSQLAYVAGFGMPPAEFAVWGLRSQADAKALLATLPDRGFKRSRGVFANGADNAMDIPTRDPGSPWRGPMGRTAAVAVQDTTVFQGSAAAGVRALTGQRNTASDGPAAVAAAGVQSGGGAVVQALMFGPALGLAPSVDPAILLNKTPAQAREAIAAAMDTPPAGVPLYGAAMLADVQSEAGALLAISLAYDDCEQAAQATEAMATLWRAGPGEPAPPAVTTSHTHEAAGGCAALVLVDGGQGDANAINPAFQLAVNQFYRRALGATRIGTTP